MNTATAHQLTRKRTADFAFSIFLFVFGAYGLWVDHLHALGEDAAGLHLHDVPAPFMCATMICASFVMLAVLTDDCDAGPSGMHSESAGIGRLVGMSLLGADLLIPVFT
jgi:hypothetical protein